MTIRSTVPLIYVLLLLCFLLCFDITFQLTIWQIKGVFSITWIKL